VKENIKLIQTRFYHQMFRSSRIIKEQNVYPFSCLDLAYVLASILSFPTLVRLNADLKKPLAN